MATDSKKQLDRVHKLLRLAAKSSDAPEPERISAALAAAELFVTLETQIDSEKRDRRSNRPSGPPPQRQPDPPTTHNYRGDVHAEWGEPAPDYAPFQDDWVSARDTQPEASAWHHSKAPQFVTTMCQYAGCRMKVISGNETAWRRVNGNNVEWLHDNCPREGKTL